MHQRLVIVRHGLRTESVRAEPLRHGADGNAQTLAYAEAMVRLAATNELLRRKAAEITAACAAHDEACEIEALFEFVRDEIRYVDDPPGVERIADAETTLAEGAGDCGDKAILLRSLALTLGHKSRFVVQDWDGVVDAAGYDHVHPEFLLAHGGIVQADPTERSGVFRWEAPSKGRAVFIPFDEAGAPVNAGMDFTNYYPSPVTHHQLSGFFEDYGGQLINTGIQVGSQYASSQAQQSRVSAQQTKAIGAEFEKKVSQAHAYLAQLDAKAAMGQLTTDDYNNAVAVVQDVESFVQQYPIEYVTTQWNSSAYKGAAQNYLTSFQRALQSSGQGSVAGGQTPSILGDGQLAVGGVSISSWALAIGVVLLVVAIKKN